MECRGAIQSFMIVLLIIISGPIFGADPVKKSYSGYMIMKKESYIHVNGQSNINQFNCHYSYKDTIKFSGTYNEKALQLDHLSFHIPVKQFNCGNFIINKDFERLLKARHYPFIKLSVENIKIPDSADKNRVLTDTRMTLAGVTREYNMPLIYTKDPKGIYTIQGQTEINIKDFDINKLKKVFGIIRFKKTVKINFQFIFDVRNKFAN